MANKYAVETAFKLIDRATEPLTKIGVKGNAIGKALKKDFMKAQDQLAGLGKAAVKAGGAIAAAGTAAVTAWAVKGVKDAIEYDTALRKVSTVADTTSISMEKLSKGLMRVSNETGTAVAELADLQYSAIVSGIKTADSVEFVETAVKAATASFTDTATVIDGLTAVLNAYGMEASEASKIAGQMLITNNLGKTSFQELNGALGKVLPTAARLNVGTDELFASITALTANSIETPKAIKGLEKILETVQRPTDAAAKAARRLGIDFSVSAIRSKGLAGFLKDIQEKTGGSEEAIMSLFGSVESLNAITVLTGKGAGQFSEALSEMQNATEKLNSAFETIDASPAERWGDIVNIIRNAGINLGTKLLPIIEKITVKVEEVVGKLQDYDFTPIADKIGIVFDKIFQAGQFFVWLAGVVWELRVPILAVAGAVAVYRGGMVLAAAAINGFKVAQSIAKGVQLAAALATGNQTKAMALYKAGTMGATIQTVLFAARQKAIQGLNFTKTIVTQGLAFVVQKTKIIASTAATLAHAAAQKAVAVASKIAAAGQWALNAAMNANPISLVVAGIVLLAGLFVLLYKKCEPFRNLINNLLGKFKELGILIFEGLGRAFKALIGYIKENSEKVLAFIAVFTGPFGFVISIIKELKDNWSAIVEVFKTDGIIEGFKRLGGVILSAVLAPIQGVLEVLSNIPGAGKLLGPAVEKIKNFREELKGNEAETTVIQKIVPAGVTDAIPRTITQTTAAANAAVSVPSYGVDDRNNRTITAAAAPVTAPMTTAEQYMYSQTTNREQIDIGVRAEPGTSASVTRGRPRSPNVSLVSSGGN